MRYCAETLEEACKVILALTAKDYKRIRAGKAKLVGDSDGMQVEGLEGGTQC